MKASDELARTSRLSVRYAHRLNSAVQKVTGAFGPELPHAPEVEQFINEHKPDVVVYDVPMPYGSSWDLLDVIRSTPSRRSQPFVITTRNKRKLEELPNWNAVDVALR